uniref:U-box domain-containing protein n=1 Tax=Phytophthora ramorum TaxID=164328 RepID=H3HCX8_PHYRM
MFLCGRDTSARPHSAVQEAERLPPTPDEASASAHLPLSAIPRTRSPSRRPHDASDPAAYLQLLDALTRLVTQLLDVHNLSPSLRFSAGESVDVNAAEWWKQVQTQSIALVQRQEATKEANGDAEQTAGRRLWPLTARAQETTPEQQLRPLWTLEQVDAGVETETLVKILASVDEGVAFAASELLQRWAPRSQKMVVDSADKLARLMGVAVVNALLQPRNIGSRHTFHDHALLPSLPLRAFLGAKQWKCSVCERMSQTVGSDGARAACVYRCAACNFNLCRECFTRIPNAAGSRPNSPLMGMTKPATDRFFALIVPKLKRKTGAVVIRQIAQELRRRVLELYPHNFQAAAGITQLFYELLASDKTDPRRRLNYDAHERLDGFLVNVTTMLLAYTLPLLEKAQHDPSYIDTRYHQSVEPVRVYASAKENAASAEISAIKSCDESFIAKYNSRRVRKVQQADGDVEVEEASYTYYPHLSCHEGVVCDRCEFPNLHGVRYKCAFCEDMDFCSDCFEIFRSHQVATDSSSESESEAMLHNPDHVFIRIESPIPVFAVKHFQPLPLPVPWETVVRKLHFRRLLHPPALIPRLRFPRDTEVFYVTLKYLHFGPLATLSRWLSMAKELHELQAFCACDEERLELEGQRQRRGRRRQNGSERRSLKPSVHYKASKARLEEIRVKSSTVPPDSTPGAVSQDPFTEPLSHFSSTFSGFPEHFFFDLCDVVYLLGLEKLEYRDLVAELKNSTQDAADSEGIDEVTEVVEPLLIMLTQIVVAPKFTKNPHLRVEALRSLSTLLTNNGLAFTSAATSGDHMLWGFLPTRVSVTMLLRYLWQLPSQRQSLLQMLSMPDDTPQPSLSAEPSNGSTQQLTGLIHDLIEDSLDGGAVVLPFRRDMLDGYVAINAKQLRLTMRLLLEALELTSWFVSLVSGESSFHSRSLAAPATALRHVLLQPLVVEQAARTVSFLAASLANAHEEQEWAFSLPLAEDGKLLLAHLIVLVRAESLRFICIVKLLFAIIVLEDRSTSFDDVDDVEEVRAAAEDVGHELDEDEALALLEKQATSTPSSADGTVVAKKRLGKRFIATLAKDGRFDFRLFVGGCRFLRPNRKQDSSGSDGGAGSSDEEAEDMEDGYLYLDDSWEADEMIHVQEAMEACLGDIPDQYLDPLLSTLMMDPVRLPSGNIVDRAVIARHLLASSQQGGSTGRDPFTREPLTMAMVEPCDALRSEIQMYLRTKMRHFRKTAREDVLATWGLGWDVLFDSSSETEADSEDGAEGSSNAANSSTPQ